MRSSKSILFAIAAALIVLQAGVEAGAGYLDSTIEKPTTASITMVKPSLAVSN